MKAAVLVFPGSNCERDAAAAITASCDVEVDLLWHTDVRGLLDYRLIVLPGGFAYGDYLRAGAIAAVSPAIAATRAAANAGRLVLGICNGFQILCEAGLLPGALRPNTDRRFHCHSVRLRVERADLPFTAGFAKGDVIDLPIAHGEGGYFLAEPELAELEARGGVVFRYVDAAGEVASHANPNGSLHSIAGIVNESGTVMGLMPHPERNAFSDFGTAYGRTLFRSALLREGAVR